MNVTEAEQLDEAARLYNDITQRIGSENWVQSRLIETMATPMLVLNTDGRIIDLNPCHIVLAEIVRLDAQAVEIR